MSWTDDLATAAAAGIDRVGGKAAALSRLIRNGIKVPGGLCVPTDTYREFVQRTGLGEWILMELHRKPLDAMRWEELWDAALRIRNRFAGTRYPDDLYAGLRQPLEACFGNRPVAVRSSAPGEDTAGASFAGLHESIINVCGAEAILDGIKTVWASLWSDAALMYRKELDLRVDAAAMAVVVQDLVNGEVSGVGFSRAPADPQWAIIEAVHGLNQGLVDGVVAPDRWFIHRNEPGRIRHEPTQRTHAFVTTPDGIACQPLDPEQAGRPPLAERELSRVYDLVRSLEDRMGTPQDVEWTLAGGQLFALQARPITAASEPDSADPRAWYRTLTRTFDHLKRLRDRIENTILPAMQADIDAMTALAPDPLEDTALATTILERQASLSRWTDVYWDELIPFAHGVRLFGQFYNDTMHPDDPYEFVGLLAHRGFKSVARNERLETLAAELRADDPLRRRLAAGSLSGLPPAFRERLQQFVTEFGDLETAAAATTAAEPSPALIRWLLTLAGQPPSAGRAAPDKRRQMELAFLARVPPHRQREAREMLDLGRASYRLRDDDNLYINDLETQYQNALQAGRRRLIDRGLRDDAWTTGQICALLRREPLPPPEAPPQRRVAALPSGHALPQAPSDRQARQLVGQPSSPGVAEGPARVVANRSDGLAFRQGDILVCDAIGPEITFVVPLAGAIVERRGGMLIHGAIIAREYGIPCVTGVEAATQWIRTGDRLTVDGYLGIVRRADPTDPDDPYSKGAVLPHEYR